MGGIAFDALLLIYHETGDSKMTLTATYLILIFTQYINILSRRKHGFLFSNYLLTNKKLWYSMGITLVIIIGLIYSPIGSLDSIGFKPLTLNILGMYTTLIIIMLAVVETKKYFFNQWIVRVFGSL